MKLFAIRIFVLQWDDACRYYREMQGLKERFRNDEIGWAEFDLNGPCMGLEQVEPDDPEGNALVGRFVGVSLRVEDLQASYQDFLAKGVKFSAAPESQPWSGSLSHFEDPDGNVLTLLG